MTIYTRPVHYYETDRMDCVHHSNYLRWYEDLEAAGIVSPVLSVEANYHSMCRFGDTVEIAVEINSYSRTRISFHYQVKDKATGQSRCDGWTYHCFINRSGRPVSLKKAMPEYDRIAAELLAEKEGE